ncbi:MAG: amino acid kinase family protein, partial [Anaerolineae bacterium]
DALVEAGLPAVSFPPSATARCRAGQLLELTWEPLVRALDAGLLPVVYGDVAFDDAWGCTIVSTEELFAYLTPFLRPERILLAGIVNGVFTADPLSHPEARLLTEIPVSQLDALEAELGLSHGVDVTGGMWSKVRIMAELVRRHPGLEVHIFSGERPGAVQACLLDPSACAGTRLVF